MALLRCSLVVVALAVLACADHIATSPFNTLARLTLLTKQGTHSTRVMSVDDVAHSILLHTYPGYLPESTYELVRESAQDILTSMLQDRIQDGHGI
jgi:hypothetical protein